MPFPSELAIDSVDAVSHTSLRQSDTIQVPGGGLACHDGPAYTVPEDDNTRREERRIAKHRFAPTQFYDAMGSYSPVLELADGDRIATWTPDAHGHDGADQSVSPLVNPQVGPFALRGAEPGDVLALRLEVIRPNRRRGYSNSRLASHLLEPADPLRQTERLWVDWDVDVAHGVATVDRPELGIKRVTVPLRPMLGCIGVAPAGPAVSTSTSGTHGGNMDYPGYGPGVVAYFPVAVAGGLFFLGDGHVAQSDGEIVGMGIEVSMDVVFSAWVQRKGRPIGWPRLETAERIIAIGNARPLEDAQRHATSELLRWVMDDYGLGYRTAALLLGQAARYEIANVVDPAYTVACSLQKALLPG